jgi:peptidyl-prolyl cis-trans isomerase D
MRKHAGSWLIKVVLGVIVVVFIFWGVGSYRAQRGNRVAVVNGEVIALEQYRDVYDKLMDQYRRQLGSSLDQKLLKTLGLKRQALDQLINRSLLFQKADQLGLHVTKEEQVRAIQKMAAFQYNGRFDPRRYQKILAVNRMTPEMFEESIRQDLLMEKMQGFILGSIKVSDSEALENFKWREEKINLEYVVFKPSSYKDLKVTSEEVETYFSKHTNSYEIPPKVKVKYVRFGFKDFESQIKVSEEEISQYFELNKNAYSTPKKVRARHILFKTEPDAKEEKLDEVRNNALKVLKEARARADFAKLAEKYSDDPGSKNKGGDLGFFARDRMIKPFSEAAFAMKLGEISEPVQTPFGWHLIKVEEIQEAKEPVLAEEEVQIRSKLLKEGARNLAYDGAEEMYDASYAAGHIADVETTPEIEIIETEFFGRLDRVKGIKESTKFAEVAFNLGDEDVNEPLELIDGYYILEVIDRKPAEIPELGAVEKKVSNDLIGVKRDELARKDAEEFLKAIKKGNKFEAEAKNRQLDVKSTGFFKRFGSIPGIGSEREIMDAAFSLSPSKALPESVIKGRQGHYVIRLKEQQEVDPKEFEAKKSEIKSGIISQKGQKLINEWFAQLRQESEITIVEGFLE